MPVVGSLLRSADFQRALGQRPAWRSAHFALHHVAAGPKASSRGQPKLPAPELSTGDALLVDTVVDDTPAGRWLGAVLPKRHARRAVTRNLLRRQIRSTVQMMAPRLPLGLWVVRLKAPFDKLQYGSAASMPLRQAARSELLALLAGAAL